MGTKRMASVIALAIVVTMLAPLDTYGGAGGPALFGDLRFGAAGHCHADIRGSLGVPVSRLIDS